MTHHLGKCVCLKCYTVLAINVMKRSSYTSFCSYRALEAMDDVQLTARLRVPVDDSEDQQICAYFAESFEFIRKAMDTDAGHVLIHCKHGQSRSATIAAAYLLERQRGSKSVPEVLSELRQCRPRVSPNTGFLQQLERHACAVASFA